MTKYIKKKSIDHNKANDILSLNSIDKVAWNFILSIYKLGWNSLITDKENRTFRQHVALKFTPKLQKKSRTSINKDK